jgi:hypothetical protein
MAHITEHVQTLLHQMSDEKLDGVSFATVLLQAEDNEQAYYLRNYVDRELSRRGRSIMQSAKA